MKAEDYIEQVKVGGFDQAEYVAIDDAREAVKLAKAEQITPTIKRRGLTMETDAQELAVSLKTYRVRNGFTLPQLGKMWGTSRYTLMRIEAAKHVSWVTMYKIANQLIQAIQNEKQ